MNKVYRSVWNEATRTWVAVQENAVARGKRSAGKLVRAIAGAAIILGFAGGAAVTLIPDVAVAGPTGGLIPGVPTGAPNGTNGNAGGGTGNPGIWVNDSMTGGCIVAYDAASGTGGGTGNQWYGINNAYGSKYLAGCDATGALGAGAYNNQTNRVLFFGQGNGATSLSLGGNLYVNGGHIGLNDNVAGTMAMSIGNEDTVANANNAIAVGNNSTATASSAVALGSNAAANNANDVALGAGSTTAAAVATTGTKIAGTSYTFAGTQPTSTVSVGSAGKERTVTNVAAGQLNANSTDAVNGSQLYASNQAIESLNTNVTNLDNKTVQYDTNSDGTVNYNSVTLGGDTYNTTTHTGGTKITNVADGTNPSDAVNYSQLTETNNSINNIYDTGTKYFHANSTGADSQALGQDSVAIGMGAAANNANDVALGAGSTTAAAVATTGTTIGGTSYSFAGAQPNGTVSVGSAGNERTITNVAAGQLNASSTDAVNGSQLYATNQAVDQNTADITNLNGQINNVYADGTKYFHANSTGADSQALGQDSVAVGMGATANNANDVALGAGSVTRQAVGTSGATIGGDAYTFAGARPNGTVSVGSAGNERTMTNVAAGQLNASSTDAVNGSQLYATNQAVDQISNSVTNLDKGSVKYDTNTDGTINYSSVTLGGGVDGTVIHNVAAGTDGTDAVNVDQLNAAVSSVSNVAQNPSNPFFKADGNRDAEGAVATGTHSTAMGPNANAGGTNSVAIGAGSNASTENSVALGANSLADRANTVSVGSVGNERQVVNVAPGTQGTDAVNLNQLGAASLQSQQYTDQQIGGVQMAINQVARDAYSGVAAATALTMIPDVDLGKKIAVGVGTANYKGYQATAIGATARVTQNVKVRVGAGTSAGGTTVGVGASYQW